MKNYKKYALYLLILPVLLLLNGVLSVLFYAGGEDITPSDCIVVFGAHLLPDNEPSKPLIERTEMGINLFNSGYADFIVFSGGVTNGQNSEAEAMKRIALREDIDESKIITETQSFNTEQNVEYSLDRLTELNCDSAIFVSHYYHLGRIELIANRNGFDAAVHPAKADPTLIDKKLLLQEFFKYSFTWLFYWG